MFQYNQLATQLYDIEPKNQRSKQEYMIMKFYFRGKQRKVLDSIVDKNMYAFASSWMMKSVF